MNKFLCIFVALFAVCNAGLPYGAPRYDSGVHVAGLQYQLQPRATLQVLAPAYGRSAYAPSRGYGVGPVYGAPIVAHGYGSGIGHGLDRGLAHLALNLPSPGIGYIPEGPVSIPRLSAPILHSATYGAVPSVAKSSSAAAAASSVRSHVPAPIPAITIPGSHYNSPRGAY